jgi:hypothetical protein
MSGTPRLEKDQRRWAFRVVVDDDVVLFTMRFITKVEAQEEADYYRRKYGYSNQQAFVFERLWQTSKFLRAAWNKYCWTQYDETNGPDYLRPEPTAKTSH